MRVCMCVCVWPLPLWVAAPGSAYVVACAAKLPSDAWGVFLGRGEALLAAVCYAYVFVHVRVETNELLFMVALIVRDVVFPVMVALIVLDVVFRLQASPRASVGSLAACMASCQVPTLLHHCPLYVPLFVVARLMYVVACVYAPPVVWSSVSSYEEALGHFRRAQESATAPWLMNYLWLVKCLTRVGRHGEAGHVLRDGLKLTPVSLDDQQVLDVLPASATL